MKLRRLTAMFVLSCVCSWQPSEASDPASAPAADAASITPITADGRPSLQAIQAAVVRVYVAEKGSQSVGSGTLIDIRDQFGLVVTNWHVIRDAAGEITVVFPDGFRSAARVVKQDKDWDLAALSIWRPHAAPVRVSTRPPAKGELLGIAGYGSDGVFRLASGACTQYMSPSTKHPFELIEVAVSARQGDSGGPIFNEQGELAGVLFGSSDGTTAGSYGGRVSAFLSPILGSQIAAQSPGTQRLTPPSPLATTISVPTIRKEIVPEAHPKETNAVQEFRAPSAVPVTLGNIAETKSKTTSNPPAAAPLETMRSLEPAHETTSGFLATGSGSLAAPPLNAGNYAAFDVPQWSGETRNKKTLDMQELIGRSPLEQFKTALAIVGLFALLIKFAPRPARND